MQTEKEPLQLVAQWILSSGIQSESGGFYAWYDLQDKSYPYLYSEITGYGITSLLYLYKTLKDKIFIEKAEQSAEWIIRYSLHPCGGIRTRLYQDDEKADKRYSFQGENIFSFDTGMVLYAMVNLYTQTKDERFLKISKMLAKFLLDKMQNKDGSLSAIYNARAREIVPPRDDKWSNQPGGFHAKVSLGLVELFKVTQDESYHNAAIRLCEYALSTQDNSGRFITDRQSRTTHIHPHCYAAEGLWYTGVSFGISKFIQSAKKATEWVYNFVSSDGINELYDPSSQRFNMFQRSDILAQVLRLGLIFSFKHKIEELREVLLGYQYHGKDAGQRGGFLFCKGNQHINSWCSMFAIQALALYKDKDLIPKETKIDLFI